MFRRLASLRRLPRLFSSRAAENDSAASPQFIPQVQRLRSQVEAELKSPAVILVTSATPGDGARMVAHALADRLLKGGRRAALIVIAKSQVERDDVPEVCLPHETARAPLNERMAALVATMRARYDYTVVEGGPFFTGNAVIALAQLVDGILLAVRVGRGPTDQDELMMQTLERSGGRVLGLVAADGEPADRLCIR